MVIFFYPILFLLVCLFVFLLFVIFLKGFSFRFFLFFMRIDLTVFCWSLFLILFFFGFLLLQLPFNFVVTSTFFILIFDNFGIVCLLFFLFFLFCLLYTYWRDSLILVTFGVIFLFFILLFLCSVSILVFSNDLYLIFLTVELCNILLLLFFSLRKDWVIFLEALIKLFWLNTLSGCFFLLGLVFLYFAFGSLLLSDFDLSFFTYKLYLQDSVIFYNKDITNFLPSTDFFYIINSPDIFFILFGIFFLFISFALKLGIFPFHNWVVDIIHGCYFIYLPFYYVLSKFLYFFLFIKIFKTLFFFIQFFEIYTIALVFLALFGMFFLLLFNLHQLNLKRLFAISGSLQFSYVFLAVSFGSQVSWYLLLFFFSFYLLNIFGFLYSISCFRKIYDLKSCNKLTELSLFAVSSNSAIRFFLTSFLFIFIGIPPFFSFFFKYYISILYLYNQSIFIFIFLLIFFLFSAIISFIYLKCIIFLNTITSNIPPISIKDISFFDVFIIYSILSLNLIFLLYLPLFVDFFFSLNI